MSQALKELTMIINVKEAHRRREMLKEWTDTWIDTLEAREQHADEGVPSPELRAKRYAELGTQMAHGLLATGEEHGAVEFSHGKDHTQMKVLILRPRRKTKEEMYASTIKTPAKRGFRVS
jgi:hypothetical protein